MEESLAKRLNISYNPSGAAKAAEQGHVVMVVDVIDMSTTAESALNRGVVAVFGAAPDHLSLPVMVNPEKIGFDAGRIAADKGSVVIIAAEPRLEGYNWQGLNSVKKGINMAGGEVETIIPNLGREVDKLVDFKEKVLVIVSASGGVTFDTAYNNGATDVFTGTVARVHSLKGKLPAELAAKRAIESANNTQSGISIIAASSNSWEDVLAAEYIGKIIIGKGFLQLN